MIARIEITYDAPVELIRLLSKLGLEAVLWEGDAGWDVLSAVGAALILPAGALRVRLTDRISKAPAIVTIVISTVAVERIHVPAVDFATDSTMAAACFILSRVLGLHTPILTGDRRLFEVIYTAVELAAGSENILVEGEVGVGKESWIKMIHAASSDRASLIHAECAGIDDARVIAEIGPSIAEATDDCRHGSRPFHRTIFFNHIGELSKAAQGIVLELICKSSCGGDHKLIIGSGDSSNRRESDARVRYLAASSTPLAAMAAGGEFLSDLYQIFDVTLTIPPLRERPDDLPILVGHALRSLNSGLTLNAAALRALSRYPFPGNLRELTNFVTRIAIVPATSPSHDRNGLHGIGTVGGAEVHRQLGHGNLKSLWRSRGQGLSSRSKLPKPSIRAEGRSEGQATPGNTETLTTAVTELRPITHP